MEISPKVIMGNSSKIFLLAKTHPLIFASILIIIWRFILSIGWVIGLQLIPGFFPSFPYSEDVLIKRFPFWLWPWANFDGVHYLKIAEHGYVDKFSQVFFPLYPLLIRWLGDLINHYLLAGLIVSHVSLIIALFLLIKLCTYLKISYPVIILLLILYLLFPTSYYFGSIYTESLYLMFSIAAFYFVYQKKWWLSGISGLLACLTRISGIFLFPSLAILWYQHRKSQPGFKYTKLFNLNLIWLLMIPLGLGIYMYYLNQQLHDPLYFIHAQPYFSAHREIGNLTIWPQVVWRYFKMTITVPWNTPTFYTLFIEFITGTVFAFLSILAWKKLGSALGLYTLANYLLPTLTGSFSSVPRYVLILFPAFIVLAMYMSKYRWLKIIYFTISPLLLLSNIIYFTRGWWIA